MIMTGTEEWKPESGLDVLLMLLYASDGNRLQAPINGITRLDKLMFLVSRFEEFEPLFREDYEFIPYNFGPFATELLDDVEALKGQGLVQYEKRNPQSASETRDAEIIDEETGEFDDNEVTWDMYSCEIYSLTPAGAEIAGKIFAGASKEQQEIVTKVKTSFNNKSLTGLLRYVYRTYPVYAKRSLIREKILRA